MRTMALILSMAWPSAAPAESPQLPPPGASVAPADAALDGIALVGLVLSPDGARSSALLRSGERTRAVGLGETFSGARVAAIGAGRVTLEAGGRTRELHLASAPQTAPATAPAPALDSGDEGHVFTRAEIERRIADETPRLLAETALIPVNEDGQVRGFVISRLPENSLLTDLGLRAGDVLSEINGTPIDSMATLLALYARLQGAGEVRATVLRGGSVVPLVVHLR